MSTTPAPDRHGQLMEDLPWDRHDEIADSIERLERELQQATDRVSDLEAQIERDAWAISPAMAQARINQLAADLARVTAERDDWKIRAEEMDGYKADCHALHALRARVAELVAALRQITTDAMDVSPHIETVALNAIARAESAACQNATNGGQISSESTTPAKHPDTELLEWLFCNTIIAGPDGHVIDCRDDADAARKQGGAM